MIDIEPTQEDLFCFSAALVLTNEQTGHRAKNILCRTNGLQVQVNFTDGMK